MRKVFMLPRPSDALNDNTNSINQIVGRLAQHLPRYGWEITEDESEADLIASHAGAVATRPVDVAHCHGLYPTADIPNPLWPWASNRDVIQNLRTARAVTVPSQWVGDMLRRDMHMEPDVIGWGIEPSEWEPDEQPGDYVLWGKTRPDGICNPTTMMMLAQRVPEQRFVSTFGAGEPLPNVDVIGRQPFELMQRFIRSAGVYLADVKETFGIMTLEAMACGVPVLGYRWGATPDIVQHGVTGYLVQPGDLAGLVEGLAYCKEHRAILGANARAAALRQTWDYVARSIAMVYDRTYIHRNAQAEMPKVSVVIPLHNYGKYVAEAIETVRAQKTLFDVEIIVVDDRSTDDSFQAAMRALQGAKNCHLYINDTNLGVAQTRNKGIEASHGEYIVCLDADDRLGDPFFLSILAAALDADRTLGIAFTGLTTINDAGESGGLSAWPDGFDFDRQVQGRNQVPTCCMFRRIAWERAGGYRKAYQPSEDARLWLMMGALGFGAVQATREGMFDYRIHDGSLSDGIRKGQRPEPPWRAALPWVTDSRRPFASLGEPTPNRFSWPVRNYDRPLVTFIVPVGPGHEQRLADALDSIEAQTDRRWECVVVDDTGGLGMEPLPGHPWARVIKSASIYDDDKPLGAGAARNIGLKAARASLVVFLDADDVLEPTFLERTMVAHLRTGKYVYTDWVSLNKAGEFERHETPDAKPGDQFSRSTIHAVTVLLPTAWARAVGGFDESMTTWEDVDFFMKLAANGFCGTRVAEPLLIYRYSTGSRREDGEPIKEKLIDMLRERYHEYIVEGKEVVCCGQPVGQTSAERMQEALKAPGAADWVRVEYTGPRIATGAHACVGPSTGKNYGQRAKGDIFLVYRADLLAGPERFVEVAAVVGTIERTDIPPAPELRV